MRFPDLDYFLSVQMKINLLEIGRCNSIIFGSCIVSVGSNEEGSVKDLYVRIMISIFISLGTLLVYIVHVLQHFSEILVYKFVGRSVYTTPTPAAY